MITADGGRCKPLVSTSTSLEEPTEPVNDAGEAGREVRRGCKCLELSDVDRLANELLRPEGVEPDSHLLATDVALVEVAGTDDHDFSLCVTAFDSASYRAASTLLQDCILPRIALRRRRIFRVRSDDVSDSRGMHRTSSSFCQAELSELGQL